jgi:hypothetical protein
MNAVQGPDSGDGMKDITQKKTLPPERKDWRKDAQQ